ncbi:MAG: hypothetical protein MZV63_25090 [Marinilabiliales bacterium]|nr:hypothetical protein [Marinilabiliales bacterium]
MFPQSNNTALLVVEGEIQVNGTNLVPADHFVLFGNDGDRFEITATEKAVVLILSGEPLREPIVAHGPFVMNTRAEIQQAFEDVSSGKFGHLDD